MPEAPHHETEIVELKGSRYKAKVVCTGCHFQTHLLPEESPEAAAAAHQARWGYKAKSVEEKPAPPKTLPPSTNSVNPPKLVVKPTGVK